MAFLLVLETFLEGILVRAGESGEYQFPGVRVPWMNRQVIALGDNVNNVLDVAEIDIRVDSLSVIVQGEIDEVDIPRTFPISKEAAFNTVCSGKNTKFGGGNASPCVQG
jgi:hypothetical protein